MRNITSVVIHTSDSSFGDVNAIRAWHTDPKPRGRGWSDCGYHFVIKNGMLKPNMYISALDGHIDVARPISITPASVKGYNTGQIAICLIGVDGKYTIKQIKSAVELASNLIDKFNLDVSAIRGHYEFPKVTKTCPNLNMNDFRDLVIHSIHKKG